MILRKKLKVSQKVLLFNFRFKLITSKLRSKWDGPFVIIEIKNEVTSKIFKVESNMEVQQVNTQEDGPYHESPIMVENHVDEVQQMRVDSIWLNKNHYRRVDELKRSYEWLIIQLMTCIDDPAYQIFDGDFHGRLRILSSYVFYHEFYYESGKAPRMQHKGEGDTKSWII
ncbi:hypothetical protein CR513_30846, partial [Mucuna pruriens]